MIFRKAAADDLPQLKTVYQKIVRDMRQKGIDIWNDFYPNTFFKEDIERGRLYVLTNADVIVAAFALCEDNEGENAVQWNRDTGKPLYLDRFGVNVGYAGKGNGSFMLRKAEETARSLGADCLRLFVVDINSPAIGLYEKSGYLKAEGVYDEVINDRLVFHEYGYEKKL